MGQAKKRGTREERIASAKGGDLIKAIEAVTHKFICPECGTNRLESPCPNETGECPMNGRTISIPIEDDGTEDLAKNLGIPPPSAWNPK